ncbi:MAG: hypothetical protein JWO89_347 [Verrucomicrobiaceae bacterium]|nr:hypothetical protein [Verrucomicrobiaceae bacterium]
MTIQVQALSLLCHLRVFVSESARRQLSADEVVELRAILSQLSESVEGDLFASRHVLAIREGLMRAVIFPWRGSDEVRRDVILHSHALSGHFIGGGE